MEEKSENVFKITSFQPNDCVTCSSVLVEVDGLKILLDLGLVQDSAMTFRQLYDINMDKLRKIPFDELTHVVISHAHYDHISGLPILARGETNFSGTVISTELTAELGRLVMEDAQRINQSDVAIHSATDREKYSVYYDKEDVAEIMTKIQCYEYEQKIKLSDKVTLELLPSCHLSGASMIYITYKDECKTKHLLFTGDFTYGHTVDRPFTKKVLDKCLKADVVICESTYGLRGKETLNDENPIDVLEEVILREVVCKNKTLWIPSFAVHRATTLYLYLYEIFQRNEEIRKATFPVYFCGQMLFNAHRIIGKDKYNCYYDDEWAEKKDIFRKEPFGFLTTKKDVEHFCQNNGRKIVVSSSGMFDRGYSGLLAESYVANKKVSVLACGYLGEGTLGQQIRVGASNVVVNGIGKTVRCSFERTIPNLSGHATHNGLISFIKSLHQDVLQDVILVHGTTQAKTELKEDLQKELTSDKKVHVIQQFQTISL